MNNVIIEYLELFNQEDYEKELNHEDLIFYIAENEMQKNSPLTEYIRFVKVFRNLIIGPLVTMSMSRKENCWDNPVPESFFHTVKLERVYQTSYFSGNQSKMDTFEYI